MEISSLPSPLLQCTYNTLPLCCVLVFSSLFIQFFFFCGAGGQSVQGAMLVYPRCGWGNTDAWCLPVGLPNVSQAGLEPASGSMVALLFSQCNVAWRNFVWAGGSGCWSSDSF
jgi:hypothetical protein